MHQKVTPKLMQRARLYLGASWILLVLITFLVALATSALLRTVAAILSPLMSCEPWQGGPPLTVAEMLHGSEPQS